MTPEEAREIDRLEFEAECRAVRERVFARIAERHGTVRARMLHWFAEPAPVHVPRPRLINKVNARRYEHDGQSLTIQQWSNITGHSTAVLRRRLKMGMTTAQAFTIPKMSSRRPWRDQLQPGVGGNFRHPLGTGGGPTTQDFTEIEFSQ